MLVAVSGYVFLPSGGASDKTPGSASTRSSAGAPTATPTARHTGALRAGANASGTGSATGRPGPATSGVATTGAVSTGAVSTGAAASGAAPAPPARCLRSQLTVAGATDAASHRVNSTPVLAIVITDVGPRPCVADLSDAQIELRLFSGSARVWGSHDCVVQPGTSLQTLPVGRPVRRGIRWSGLSSQPKCAGTRLRVGAGTYTLFALFAGQPSAGTVFDIR
jgi:hypothetical protein